jgi:hypothetical protein
LKGDFYVLQQMQQTQNKTAKQHRETTRQLIMPFFKESSDPMVDYIKKNLFNVNTPARDAPWGPIVPPENPIMKAMMALPRPSVNGVHPALRVRSTARRRTPRAARRAHFYTPSAACIDARRAASCSNACALPLRSKARRAWDAVTRAAHSDARGATRSIPYGAQRAVTSNDAHVHTPPQALSSATSSLKRWRTSRRIKPRACEALQCSASRTSMLFFVCSYYIRALVILYL